VVKTFKNSATVTAIDKANREVTLVSQNGKKATAKCGPTVVNSDQIQIGDQVKATETEELVVSLASPGSPPSDGAGALVAQTVQVTAKVKAIDLKSHKVTLQLPDVSTDTFPVRKDVDLTQQKAGAEVVIQSTETVAIVAGLVTRALGFVSGVRLLRTDQQIQHRDGDISHWQPDGAGGEQH